MQIQKILITKKNQANTKTSTYTIVEKNDMAYLP